MRVRSTIFISISILGLLFLASCGRMHNEEIRKSWWKYGDGFHVDDALRFDDLKGDTLYFDNSPTAIIVSCGKGLYRKTAVLKIEDLRTGKVGTYHEKGSY
mgnify:CR=1